jgi:hypothetical protein
MAEIVEIFQEVFTDYRPEGFDVVFAAADVPNHRLIWVHRYETGFDLTNRFYLGKFPDLAQCLWSGTRFDALAASPEGVDAPPRPVSGPDRGTMHPGGRANSTPRSLEELEAGRTVELKIYEVRQGQWADFLRRWRKIVQLRRAAGFGVEFAVADIPGRRFVWAVSVDGDFTAQNTKYLGGEDRMAANVISDHVERFEIPKVLYIPIK